MDTDEVELLLTFDQASHVYREEFVLSHAACYRLTMRDTAGEGLGNGFFQVKDSNNQIVFRGGNSGYDFTYEIAGELHCDGFVAIEEDNHTEGSETFCVTPNPTTGIVNLNLGKGQWHIQVFDIMGRKVVEQQGEGFSSLDLSQQQKGLYLLKARNDIQEYNTIIVVQ